MEKPPSAIRGLINDLTRSLTASLVHLDDLLLRIDNDAEEFGEAWLANEQLGRALEFFIELRWEYMMQDKQEHNQRLLKFHSPIISLEKALAASQRSSRERCRKIVFGDLLPRI